jgi:hypothetical protein
MIATGGFWYVRNLIHTGSPVPAIDLEAIKIPYGGFALVDRLGRTVASYATDAAAWTEWFVPGLQRYLGPVAIVTLAIAIGGALATLVRRVEPPVRAIAGVALCAVVGYAFTPTSALGPDGEPFLFVGNLVYVVPAIVLTLVATAASIPQRHSMRVIAVLIILQLASLTGSDSPLRLAGNTHVMLAITSTAVIAVAVSVARNRRSRVVGIAATSIAVVALHAVVTAYVSGRYEGDAMSRFAEQHAGSTIAWAGLTEPYRLHDTELTTRIVMIGSRGRHGAIHPSRDCPSWRRQLRDRDVSLVVLRPGDYGQAGKPSDAIEADIGLSDIGEHQLIWTRADPAASNERRVGGLVVFDFAPGIVDPGCDA